MHGMHKVHEEKLVELHQTEREIHDRYLQFLNQHCSDFTKNARNAQSERGERAQRKNLSTQLLKMHQLHDNCTS